MIAGDATLKNSMFRPTKKTLNKIIDSTPQLHNNTRPIDFLVYMQKDANLEVCGCTKSRCLA